MPPVGVTLGIIALTTLGRARKTVQSDGADDKIYSFSRTLGIVGLSLSVIALLVQIVVFVTLAGTVLSGMSQRSQDVAVIEDAQKNFAGDETVAFGPYDIRVADIQRNYTPSTSERAEIDMRLADLFAPEDYGTPTDYGQAIPDSQATYTKLTLAGTYNAQRDEQYKKISMDTPSWGSALGELQLNGRLCVYKSLSDTELNAYDYAWNKEKTEPFELTLICRGERSDDTEGTIDLEVGVFTKVSPIVGTEGMPREKFKYTIYLW